MSFHLDQVLEETRNLLRTTAEQETCARCPGLLPRFRSVQAPAAGRRAQWAMLAQVTADADAQLHIDGKAFCVECAEELHAWLYGKDVRLKPRPNQNGDTFEGIPACHSHVDKGG